MSFPAQIPILLPPRVFLPGTADAGHDPPGKPRMERRKARHTVPFTTRKLPGPVTNPAAENITRHSSRMPWHLMPGFFCVNWRKP